MCIRDSSTGLTCLVESLPLWMNVKERGLVVFIIPKDVAVLIGGKQVIAGVDAEHEHFNESAVDCLQGYCWIVAAEADVADGTVFLQL